MRTRGSAAQQTHIFDAVLQTIPDHTIAPINESWDAVVAPDQPSSVALFATLEHKAQASVVALAFHAIESASLALEAHSLRLAQTDPIDRLIGPGRQRLGHCGIDVIGNPTAIGLFGKGMQGILREVVLLSQA